MSRAEIEELRLQISALRVRVFAQEERIEELERRVGEGQRTPSSSVAPSEVQRAPPSEVGSGVGSYSLLSGSAGGSGTGRGSRRASPSGKAVWVLPSTSSSR